VLWPAVSTAASRHLILIIATAAPTGDAREISGGARGLRPEDVADQAALNRRLAELTPALWPTHEAIPAAPRSISRGDAE
jgi:hypothetical protein